MVRRAHLSQDFRFGILIGSIIHQSVSFWYILVRCPTRLAHLYNLVPYQRRARHAGQCGVEVEGGTLPTRVWFLNLQILTSGGFQ
jgi:hypothetical protein